MTTKPQTWPVQLSNSQAGYQRPELKRRHPDSPDYQVVVVVQEAFGSGAQPPPTS